MFSKENLELLLAKPFSSYKNGEFLDKTKTDVQDAVLGEDYEALRDDREGGQRELGALINELEYEEEEEMTWGEGPEPEYSGQREKIFFFVPVSIPGMGKSFFVSKILMPFCKAQGVDLAVVSSDQIRKDCMDRMAEEKPLLPPHVQFENTRKEADCNFMEEIEKKLNMRLKPNSVMFIDKNHPPNGIKKILNHIRNSLPKHYKPEIIAFVPHMQESRNFKFDYDFYITEIEKEVRYPFSLDFFIKSVCRVQCRQNHETMNGDGVTSYGIMLMFFNLFKHKPLDTTSLKGLGFDGVYKLDVGAGKTRFKIPQTFVENLTKALGGMNPGESCQEKWQLKTMLDDIEKMCETYDENQMNSSVASLNRDFSSFWEGLGLGLVGGIGSGLNEKAILALDSWQDPDKFKTKEDTEWKRIPIGPINQEEQPKVEEPKVVEQPAQVEHSPERPMRDQDDIDNSNTLQANVTSHPQIRGVLEDDPTPIETRTYRDRQGTVSLKFLNEDETLAWAQKELIKRIASMEIESVCNVFKPFRPKKIPIYQGVFTTDKSCKDTIYTLTRQILQKFLPLSTSKASNDEQTLVREDFQEIVSKKQNRWKFPASFHITTFFVGKDANKTESEFYTKFKERTPFPFEITHIVYVPGKILTAVPKLDMDKIKIENKHPHMTLMVSEYQPKMSNEVLNCLFSGSMAGFYKNGKQNYGSVAGDRHDVFLTDRSRIPVYLVKLETSMWFDAETKAV